MSMTDLLLHINECLKNKQKYTEYKDQIQSKEVKAYKYANSQWSPGPLYANNVSSFAYVLDTLDKYYRSLYLFYDNNLISLNIYLVVSAVTYAGVVKKFQIFIMIPNLTYLLFFFSL